MENGPTKPSTVAIASEDAQRHQLEIEKNARVIPFEEKVRRNENKKLTDMELTAKIQEYEENMEILLEELASAMENEEETSETSARIEKEIATMEKKLKTWRRLQDFRKTRKTGAKTSEIELKYCQ